MVRHFILLATIIVALIACFGPSLTSSVNPRDCYMWDQCRRQYEKEGTQVILWQCGTVPRGCFFRG